MSRGLSAFVGRERELEVLERGLDKARSEICVIDLVAEPGMGKSRLLHEFRQRIGDRARHRFNRQLLALTGSKLRSFRLSKWCVGVPHWRGRSRE